MIKNTSTKLDTVLLQSQNTESDEEDIVAILLNGESLYSRPVLEPDTKPQSDIVSHKKERSHRSAQREAMGDAAAAAVELQDTMADLQALRWSTRLLRKRRRARAVIAW